MTVTPSRLAASMDSVVGEVREIRKRRSHVGALAQHLRRNAPGGEEYPALRGDAARQRLAENLVERVVTPHVLRQQQDAVAVAQGGGVNAARRPVHVGAVEQLPHQGKDVLRRQAEIAEQRRVVRRPDAEGQAHAAAGREDPFLRLHHRGVQFNRHRAAVGVDVQGADVVHTADDALEAQEADHQIVELHRRAQEGGQFDAVDRDGERLLAHHRLLKLCERAVLVAVDVRHHGSQPCSTSCMAATARQSGHILSRFRRSPLKASMSGPNCSTFARMASRDF